MAMELPDARFRSSPNLELKRLSELPPEQRGAFRELEADHDFYGLLVPRRQGSANIKSVGKQTAQLFRDLTQPRRLDPALLADPDERRELIDLVLDGILEIEHDGIFVGGAEAFPLLCSTDSRGQTPPEDAVARLSVEALQYAQELASTDPAALTRAVYFYNRLPLSNAWRARFPSRAAMLEHLGVTSGPLASRMERHWNLVPEAHANGWLSWMSREQRPQHAGAGMYKLYVSPRPERIRDAFEAVVRVLAEIPGASFKLGPTAAGILRPDKLVTYFDSRQALDAAADGLLRELAGCPPHGIPFTAGIGNDGLLSWGVDPPESERKLSWIGRESWRLWVANRLGAALSTAKSTRSAPAGGATVMEPWRFAMERVRRQGVDTVRWVPEESLWSAA